MLTSKQKEQLQDAILERFKEKEFERFLAYKLEDRKLEVIADSSGTFSDIVFDVIEHAQRKDWIKQLVDELHKEIPTEEVFAILADILANGQSTSGSRTVWQGTLKGTGVFLLAFLTFFGISQCSDLFGNEIASTTSVPSISTDVNTPTVSSPNTPTRVPTNTRTNTPEPTNAPTNTPEPTNAPTNTPEPTNAPTNIPEPTNTPTNAPEPTNTPTNTPESIDIPTISTPIFILPDLVVTSLVITSLSSDHIEYRYIVRNIGRDTMTNKDVRIRAVLSNDTVFGNADDRVNDTIVIGETVALNGVFTRDVKKDVSNLTDWTYLVVKVDINQVATELDETNNTIVRQLR